MKRKRILWGTLIAIMLGAAYYFYGGGSAPNGQPALASLNSNNISELKKAFNSSASSIRLLVMLSPT